MDPLSVYMFATALSSFFGIAGAAGQSNATNAQARYQAEIARYNQKLAEGEAQFAIGAAQEKEVRHREAVGRLLSKQKVAQGGSGLVVGEGSYGALLDDTRYMGDLDAMAIAYEGNLDAYRKRLAAMNYGLQAQAYEGVHDSPLLPILGIVTKGAASLGAAGMKVPGESPAVLAGGGFYGG